MSKEEDERDEITEKIKIIATDDEKIKSFGELLTNDSSRAILQLLFNEELTALQIAEKTRISLQLVKYHIIKLQDLGVVKVTRVEKNSKSQDMKYYSASKFSMVIVPPKYSEKTKESKLLVRSFRHIYKVAGLGIAAGISGILSLPLLAQDRRVAVDSESQLALKTKLQEADEDLQTSMEESHDIAAESGEAALSSAPTPEPESSSGFADESLEFSARNVEEFEPTQMAGTDSSFFDSGDLAITLIVMSIIFGGLAAYFFVKSLKDSKQKEFPEL